MPDARCSQGAQSPSGAYFAKLENCAFGNGKTPVLCMIRQCAASEEACFGATNEGTTDESTTTEGDTTTGSGGSGEPGVSHPATSCDMALATHNQVKWFFLQVLSFK